MFMSRRAGLRYFAVGREAQFRDAPRDLEKPAISQ